jgi:hypothetical protein
MKDAMPLSSMILSQMPAANRMKPRRNSASFADPGSRFGDVPV